jgi:hypothetical protein
MWPTLISLLRIHSELQNFGDKAWWLLLFSFSFAKKEEILYHQNLLGANYAVIFLYILFSA